MPLLSDADVDARLPALPGWSRNARALTRTLQAPSFMAAVELVVRIAAVAEARDHHPDILLSYRTLTLNLTSHDSGGITARDLELAEALQPLLDGLPS